MGAAGSVALSTDAFDGIKSLIAAEVAKPPDASDLPTPRGQREEVRRLRDLLRQQTEALGGDGGVVAVRRHNAAGAAAFVRGDDDASVEKLKREAIAATRKVMKGKRTSVVQIELEHKEAGLTEDEVAVKKFKHITERDAIYKGLVAAEKDMLTEEERQEKKASVRKLMRHDSEIAVRKFAEMTPEEQQKIQNQVDHTMYGEAALMEREALREMPSITNLLEKWWQAIKIYDDKDNSNTLDKEEYYEFYKRVIKVLEDNDDPDDDMTEAEVQAAMEEDFIVDSGGDGHVSEPEFKQAIFNLADVWTEECSEGEYVEFLTTAYRTVFDPVQEDDPVVWPLMWRNFTKKTKSVKKMSRTNALELISEFYVAKIAWDNTDERKGRKQAPMQEIVIEYLENKFGRVAGNSTTNKKKLLSLMRCVENYLHEGVSLEAEQDSWLLLFARLVGAITPASGRLIPMPNNGTAGVFMMNVLEACGPACDDTAKKLPKNCSTDMEKKIKSGRSKAAIGYISMAIATNHLNTIFEKLKLEAFPKLKRLAMCCLKHLVQPVVSGFDEDGDGENDTERVHSVIPASDFLVLAADVYSAVHECPPETIEVCDVTIMPRKIKHIVPSSKVKGKAKAGTKA